MRHGSDTPDTGFLRWTLSDGAGAVVVEPQPRPDGLSLRVDWMHLVSHAHSHPVCMSAGLGEDRVPRAGGTWLDKRDSQPAAQAGPPRLRQHLSALPDLLDMGVAEFRALVRAGRIDPGTEHVLCHYSAGHFRAKLMRLLRDAGYAPDEERWFTNLHTAGNTGAASIFVMLDAARPRLCRGDRVLLIVPESGRFTLAFAQLTCVGPEGGSSPAELSRSPLGLPQPGDSPAVTRAVSELAEVWAGFRRALARVPVVRRIEDGTATLDDYRGLLLSLRQQVVDGGRWISLAAANLLGAMFVIEGLGLRQAAGWADRLSESLGLRDDQLSFLRYHAEGDEEHFGMLTAALRSGLLDEPAVTRIVRTARVTARLYALQLEELGHV